MGPTLWCTTRDMAQRWAAHPAHHLAREIAFAPSDPGTIDESTVQKREVQGQSWDLHVPNRNRFILEFSHLTLRIRIRLCMYTRTSLVFTRYSCKLRSKYCKTLFLLQLSPFVLQILYLKLSILFLSQKYNFYLLNNIR